MKIRTQLSAYPIIKRLILHTFVMLSPLAALHAAELYVATNGSDQAAGTLAAPLKTIQAAFNKAAAGDTILLREGIYREAVALKNKSGKDGAPITLKAYAGEKPVLSGLDVLKLEWKATPQAGVFVATSEAKSIAQLFYNGKPMLEARWPNCPRDTNGDWNFFSPDMWASADAKGNSYGTLVCSALAKTGWDVTGALALLNVDHQFFCWTRSVRVHKVGADTFTYDQDLGKNVNNRDEAGVLGKWNHGNKFYLFGLKQFLDAPGEWFYDAAAKKLYVFSPDGKNPAEGILEIKAREWGFRADSSCNYLTIEGVGFLGTAFKFGENLNKRSFHIVLRNSRVLHSSWTEFLSFKGSGLPEENPSEASRDTVYPTIMADNSEVQNCTFMYGALSALFIGGFYNRIENNLFSDFDYSSSLVYPPLHVNRTVVSDGKGGHDVIRYNTICRSGGIQAEMTQEDCEFAMNEVRDSYLACYGGNKDTSAVYTQRPTCKGTRIHHNWVHEGYSGTPPLPWGGGTGIRGDDLTCGLTVDHNVVWNCGSVGITIKNVNKPTPEEANRCVNNTVFDHSAYNKIKSAIIIPTVPGKAYYPDASMLASRPNAAETPNAWSTVANNLADPIYGMWFAKPLGTLKLAAGNCSAFDARTDLVGRDWYDFRPAANAVRILGRGVAIEGLAVGSAGKAPDVGAYERGDPVYWIPGQRLSKASFPIVHDHAQNVPVDRDVLMWRPAYTATMHQVYFGTGQDAVKNAGAKSPEYKGEFKGECNVFTLPKLTASQTYWWRVDATLPDQSVVMGDTWTFSTK
jgi:Right handed beta helix region/Chondroitinase B